MHATILPIHVPIYIIIYIIIIIYIYLIPAQTIRKPSSITQDELLELIGNLNKDPMVDGLLVQLPLPNQINEAAICNAVAPEKDVDGFNLVNIGKIQI